MSHFGLEPLEALETRLAPGEGIVVVTDGFTEQQNLDGLAFGNERLVATLDAARHAAADRGLSAVELGGALEAAAADFRGVAPQTDDCSLIALVHDTRNRTLDAPTD